MGESGVEAELQSGRDHELGKGDEGATGGSDREELESCEELDQAGGGKSWERQGEAGWSNWGMGGSGRDRGVGKNQERTLGGAGWRSSRSCQDEDTGVNSLEELRWGSAN